MSFLSVVRIALGALARNKMRSALTMLGIVIGVAAVIAMIAVGRGAQARVEQQIRGLGTNSILILPGTATASGVRLGSQTAASITEDDAAAIARDLPEVEVAAPSLRAIVQLVAGGLNWGTSAFGVNNDYFLARDWPLAAGRAFEPGEIAGSGKVAILGATVARQLFGDDDPLDQQIRVRHVPVTVIGVLERKGQNSFDRTRTTRCCCRSPPCGTGCTGRRRGGSSGST
jgi:putative ABC transport system permease protein